MVTHLIKLGEKQEEDNTVALNSARQAALLMLARLNPSLVLTMRAQCVELCRMPGTAVLLCLQVQADTTLSFVGIHQDCALFGC